MYINTFINPLLIRIHELIYHAKILSLNLRKQQ